MGVAALAYLFVQHQPQAARDPRDEEETAMPVDTLPLTGNEDKPSPGSHSFEPEAAPAVDPAESDTGNEEKPYGGRGFDSASPPNQ